MSVSIFHARHSTALKATSTVPDPVGSSGADEEAGSLRSRSRGYCDCAPCDQGAGLGSGPRNFTCVHGRGNDTAS